MGKIEATISFYMYLVAILTKTNFTCKLLDPAAPIDDFAYNTLVSVIIISDTYVICIDETE